MEEGLLRVKYPGTRTFCVSQPPFPQLNPVDPQVENSFVTSLSEPLADAKHRLQSHRRAITITQHHLQEFSYFD